MDWVFPLELDNWCVFVNEYFLFPWKIIDILESVRVLVCQVLYVFNLSCVLCYYTTVNLYPSQLYGRSKSQYCNVILA